MIKTVKTSSWSCKVWKAGSFVEKLLWLVSLLRGAPRHWHRKTPLNFPRARESQQIDEAFLVQIWKIRITWSTKVFGALIYVRIYSLIPGSDYEESDCKINIHQCEYETAKHCITTIHHGHHLKANDVQVEFHVLLLNVRHTTFFSFQSSSAPLRTSKMARRIKSSASLSCLAHSRTQMKQSCIHCPKALQENRNRNA